MGTPCSAEATLQVLERSLGVLASLSLKNFQVSKEMKELLLADQPGSLPELPPISERYALKIVAGRLVGYYSMQTRESWAVVSLVRGCNEPSPH